MKMGIDNKKWLGYSLFGLSFLFLLISLICCKSLSVNADEAYTLELVQHSWKEMIGLAVKDVHPPLYYVLLKCFLTFIPSQRGCIIIAGKIFSLIPFFILWIFSRISLSKKYGLLCGGLFSVLVIGMPSMIHTGIEIRMYSWGLLFVVMAFYQLLGKGLYSNRKWCLFTILSICACYTHYYACITMIIIYTLLLLYSFLVKKRVSITFWISSVINVVAFIPWGVVLINQMGAVSQDYWIDKLSINTIWNIFLYYFRPYISSYPINAFLAIILFLSCIYIIVYTAKISGIRNNIILFFGIATPVILFLITAFMSVIYKPIVVSRYLIFGIAIYWLCVSIAYNNMTQTQIRTMTVLCTFLFVGISCINLASFAKNEFLYDYNMTKTKSIMDNSADAILVTDDLHLQQCISFYSDNRVYGIDIDAGENTKHVYNDKIDNYDNSNSDSTRRIYVFSQNDIDEIKKMFPNRTNWTETQQFDIEQYHINYAYTE